MAGTITPPPSEAHKCEGRPPAEHYQRATVWTCDDCGKKFVVVVGSQYNEPYTAWRVLTDWTRGGFDL